MEPMALQAFLWYLGAWYGLKNFARHKESSGGWMQSWNFIVCNCCVRADYVSGNDFGTMYLVFLL